ncbi:hypothetical protein J5Y09_09990 [Roseomonas sp. PWR1]|uniref:Response regulatory domain-containing protein n=1 Tax=Roseomonas nitratireducens TaxID=2820810 RepID=A0ABS4ASB0_9PROT|nr:hypothetical protein [Neoroseomonas nitratireducens]MBP0464243.1 hypothetical protein [Neoroseomonas nitratireducens]
MAGGEGRAVTSACALPCAQEGPNCALFGRRALLVAAHAGERDKLSAALHLLGLEVIPIAPARRDGVVLPPRIDLVVCGSLADLHGAGDIVSLLREERPWVPLIAATAGGHAVRVDLDRGIDAPARCAGDLATLVVRAGCRVARHSRVAPAPGAATRASPPAG